MILRCTCTSPFQDNLYKGQMRVHNRTEKSGGNTYRCTVCSKEKTVDTPKKTKETTKK